MRAAAALLMALAAAGCSDPAQDAEKQLEIVQRSGDPRQICDAQRKVANAYLRQHDQKRYEEADLTAKIDCRKADQGGY